MQYITSLHNACLEIRCSKIDCLDLAFNEIFRTLNDADNSKYLHKSFPKLCPEMKGFLCSQRVKQLFKAVCLELFRPLNGTGVDLCHHTSITPVSQFTFRLEQPFKWSKTPFLTCVFKVNQIRRFFIIIHREIANTYTCVTHVLFDSNNTLGYTFICNLWVSLPSRN